MFFVLLADYTFFMTGSLFLFFIAIGFFEPRI